MEDEITIAINDWLLQYEPITEIAEIHTEELPNKEESLALRRSGTENLPLRYITEKGWYRQYQYMLLLKINSEDDLQRINNLSWLDDLNDWIDEQNRLRNYPVLTNKKVKQISCANAITFETNEDGTISVYYLQLYINIKGGN